MEMKSWLLVGIVALMLVAGCLEKPDRVEPGVNVLGGEPEEREIIPVPIPKFESCGEITTAFKEYQDEIGYYYDGWLEDAVTTAVPDAAPSAEASTEYSETNVQVAGVDEADIVKTDGKYIYVVAQGKLFIVDAYPADNARVVSSVDLEDVAPLEIFIDGDNILIFGNKYIPVVTEDLMDGREEWYYYDTYYTSVEIWDTSDKNQPERVRTIDFQGDYLSSRKIGSEVYFVITHQPNYYILEDNSENIVPIYREEEEDFAPMTECIDVGYVPPMEAKKFVIIGSLDMSNPEAEVEKETVVASGENIYVSHENLYLAESPDYYWDWWYGYVEPEEEETTVHKFALYNGEISYLGYMEAPGHILNQFSMDEFEGHFRIATTIGQVSRGGGDSTNNVYIFDDELEMTGSLEGLAPGEKIYSARFMGEKAYLVTFKKVDPLFVIDLSNPEDPKVLGKLKIPGYSDYLHPIDENHLIGLGKETVEAEEGDFAWFQGVKLAVFDVSDVEKPKEMYKIELGDRGTDSEALHDHKAFLYDKNKELLVLPVLLAEIDHEQLGEDLPANTYGDYVFQGAYVYRLSLEDGFDLRGRVTHIEDPDVFLTYGYYYPPSEHRVRRSLYIGDTLYTISESKILANSLDDLTLQAEIELE